jgi:hypothetical protein
VIPCALCSLPIENVNTPGVYVQQVGWSVNRQQGGSNQLSLRRETGLYAHGACVRLAIRGVNPRDQGSLV